MSNMFGKEKVDFMKTVIENLPEIDEVTMQSWKENPKALAKLLQGLCPPSVISNKWIEKDGIIYFTVVSNGKTNKEWVEHFKSKKIETFYVEKLILSNDFKPCEKGTVFNIAVIKGDFFTDKNRNFLKIKEKAELYQFKNVDIEIPYLIRDKFTDRDIEQMGLFCILGMHEPVKNERGSPRFLGAYIGRDGNPALLPYEADFHGELPSSYGFAFEVDKIKSVR